MAARKFKLLEESFTTGYNTTAGHPLWRGSRAENIHRGRSGIDRRRHHSLCLDSAREALTETLQKQDSRNQVGGSAEQRRQTSATQTTTAAGNAQQWREENRDSTGPARARRQQFSENTTRRNFMQDRPEKDISTNRRVQLDFEDEHGDRSRYSGPVWRQQNEYFVDETSRNVKPQRESSYYSEGFRTNETPFNSFRENTAQTRQQSANENNRQERDFRDSRQQHTSMHSIPSNFQAEGGAWQPVKVVYAEKAPSGTSQSRTMSRPSEYSTSAYRYDSREGTSSYPQRSYSDDWDGRQFVDGYENRVYPPAYETNWNGNTNGVQRQMQASDQWTSPHKSREGSYQRSTEIFKSRDNPTSLDWNGNYKTVNMPPQQNDYIDGISSSRYRAGSGGREFGYSEGREFGYPTRMGSTTYSQNGTLKTGRMEGLNPGFTGQGKDSYVTYRSESLSSPRTQQTRMDGQAFGARSRGGQVPIAYDDELPQSSRLNFNRSSGLELNGERFGDMREDYMSQRSRTTEADEKEFLGKLMKELENQRANLKPEVDKLIRSSSIVHDEYDIDSGMNSVTLEAGKNSYIDTSSTTPVFKAYVDIKEFSPKSVKIHYDQLTNKVVVEASQADARGIVGKTFTQKIALPRYADDLRLRARMNSSGVLRIEVPLLFYFPEKHEENKAKAFLSEARRNSADGSEELEIIVRPGRDYSLEDIQPEVINDTLVIWGGKGKEKKAISKFVLPPTANVKNIRKRSGNDGSLTIVIPVT